MKLTLSFSTLYSRAKQNISIVLLAVLVALLLLEAWSIKASFGVLSDSKNSTLIVPAKLVRVNFNAYDAIVKRVDSASAYSPQPFISKNPFGVNEKKPAK
jgi:hypothetical protein